MNRKSDTPLTDADHELCKAVPGDTYRGFVTLAFARNLERKLNAALNGKGACEWKENADGQYETHCNNVHEFVDGGVADNNYAYCPYCGGEIDIVPPPPTPEEIEMERGDRAHQEMKDMEDEPHIEKGPWNYDD